MNSNSDTSQLVLNTKAHLDYIYMYTGQNYTSSINKILVYLNKLSSSNKLAIYRRQVANRDVRPGVAGGEEIGRAAESLVVARMVLPVA
jgi:hypothetical protein